MYVILLEDISLFYIYRLIWFWQLLWYIHCHRVCLCAMIQRNHLHKPMIISNTIWNCYYCCCQIHCSSYIYFGTLELKESQKIHTFIQSCVDTYRFQNVKKPSYQNNNKKSSLLLNSTHSQSINQSFENELERDREI